MFGKLSGKWSLFCVLAALLLLAAALVVGAGSAQTPTPTPASTPSPTGTISGTVTHAGSPFKNARVVVYDITDHTINTSAFSQTNGSYSLANLGSGSYLVFAGYPSYANEYYSEARWEEDATVVSVTDGQNTGNINFTLDTGGSISGVVRDKDGNPIAGADVYVNPQDHNEPWWWAIGQESYGYYRDVTGSDGAYFVRNLGTGSYVVRASVAGYDDKYYDGARVREDATPVAVVEGQNRPDIDFSLAPSVPGDANGDGKVTMVDAMLIAQCVVGLIDCGSIDQAMADVNCSGTVTMVDAMLVAQYVVGLIDEFPCGSP